MLPAVLECTYNVSRVTNVMNPLALCIQKLPTMLTTVTENPIENYYSSYRYHWTIVMILWYGMQPYRHLRIVRLITLCGTCSGNADDL